MRNAIQEYLNYTNEEKKELWNHATFVFDTNVYLNLYRYTGKTREQLLSALSELKDRLWMPNQIAHEFMKHRVPIIIEMNQQYDSITKNIIDIIDKSYLPLHLDKEDSDMEELKTMIRKQVDKIKKSKVAVTTEEKDRILEKLLALYNGKVGTPLTEQEIAQIEGEGKGRYEKEVPPGYKDYAKKNEADSNNAFGDLLFWKEILKYAASQKKDIVLITDDQKEDWWYIVHGQTIGPRIELKKEFMDETKQKFHMYSMSNFIKRYEDEKKVDFDDDTIREIDYYSRIRPDNTKNRSLNELYEGGRHQRIQELMHGDEELKIAMLQSEIYRLEKKNQKRLDSIKALRIKIKQGDLPADLESTVMNTFVNYEADGKRILQLKEELQFLKKQMEYRIAKQRN